MSVVAPSVRSSVPRSSPPLRSLRNPRLPVNASVLHCIATYFFCGMLLLFSVLGDLIVTPYLLKLQLTPATAVAAASSSSEEHSIRAAQRLYHGALEVLRAPEEALSHIPWTATNPLGLFVLSYGIVALNIPVWLGCAYAHKVARLPKGPTLRKRLRHGNSALGRGLARLADHFDDSTYAGHARLLRRPMVCALLGLTMLLWIVSQYLWVLSLRDLSLPAANVILYTFLFIVGASETVPLNNGRSCFKIFCAMLSWIGVCIFYFPGKKNNAASSDITELYTSSEDIFFSRGFICAALGACCFAAYLLTFRRLNAPGPMPMVMGWQGLGSLVGGVVLLAAAHFWGLERFHLPTTSSDWKTLALHVLIRGLQLFALNSAIRWGDAFCVATSVPVIPAVSYLLEGVFTGEDGGFVVTQSKLFAVLFTTIACGLMCSWYFLKISAVRSRMRFGPLAIVDDDDDEEFYGASDEDAAASSADEADALLIQNKTEYRLT